MNINKWLIENTKEEYVHFTKEITLPFTDRRNDYIQIYIKYDGSCYRITDDGYTINNSILLPANHVFNDRSKENASNNTRKYMFEPELRLHNIKLADDEEELYCTVSEEEDIPLAIINLMQCIMDINHLFFVVEQEEKRNFKA